jgi:hypothetical protein
VAFLLVATSPTTFSFQGQSILLNYLLLHTQVLDTLGLGGFSLQLPPAASGLFIWSQVVTSDGTIQAGNIVNTWIIG